MQINRILTNNKVNGPGSRYIIWVQGCSIHCDGCGNTDTWDFSKGEKLETQQIVSDIEKYTVDGITLTGGEPLDQYDEVLNFLKIVFPKYNIFLTSGYTFEQIQKDKSEILEYIDILVSGPFKKDLLDSTSEWRGSTNQIVHYLTERSKQFQNYKKEFVSEIRINKKTHLMIRDGFSL
jgi:anaerobic ribonucleoside-triphosphate reductase activating protein